jgi:acetylcholinesterase
MAEQTRSKGVSLTWLAALPVILATVFAAYPGVFRSSSGPEPAPSVTIKQGTIIGKFVDDGTFPQPLEGFMGIPYAIPPVGERRFRPAEPVAASNETIEAYYLGPRYVPITSFPMRC